MFMHSQRLRAALRTMRHRGGRVLTSVQAVVVSLALIVALAGSSAGQGGMETGRHGNVAIGIHGVAGTGRGDGGGQKGRDQHGPNRPEEPDTQIVILVDLADGRDKRSRAAQDDDDAPGL
jgi:hypothetical protein